MRLTSTRTCETGAGHGPGVSGKRPARWSAAGEDREGKNGTLIVFALALANTRMGRMWAEHTREHKGSAENNALRNGQTDRRLE